MAGMFTKILEFAITPCTIYKQTLLLGIPQACTHCVRSLLKGSLSGSQSTAPQRLLLYFELHDGCCDCGRVSLCRSTNLDEMYNLSTSHQLTLPKPAKTMSITGWDEVFSLQKIHSTGSKADEMPPVTKIQVCGMINQIQKIKCHPIPKDGQIQ